MGFPAMPPVGRPWTDAARPANLPGALTALNRTKETKPATKSALDPQTEDSAQKEAEKNLRNFVMRFDDE